MAITEIDHYYTWWTLDLHYGNIILYDKHSNILSNYHIGDKVEYQIVMDLLRNEKPLWFDTASSTIKTGSGAIGEPVGEQES